MGPYFGLGSFANRPATVLLGNLAVNNDFDDDAEVQLLRTYNHREPSDSERAQLKLMRPHAVLVDVSIDQGGCFETSRPTTHSNPTFEVDSITHYCVTNMPGAVPITSTYALTNATLPYVIELADRGVREALDNDPYLRLGLNVDHGEITHPAVAAALGMAPSAQAAG